MENSLSKSNSQTNLSRSILCIHSKLCDVKDGNNITDVKFHQCIRQFSAINTRLSYNPALESFQIEYGKLFKALGNSQRTCQNLRNQINLKLNCVNINTSKLATYYVNVDNVGQDNVTTNYEGLISDVKKKNNDMCVLEESLKHKIEELHKYITNFTESANDFTSPGGNAEILNKLMNVNEHYSNQKSSVYTDKANVQSSILQCKENCNKFEDAVEILKENECQTHNDQQLIKNNVLQAREALDDVQSEINMITHSHLMSKEKIHNDSISMESLAKDIVQANENLHNAIVTKKCTEISEKSLQDRINEAMSRFIYQKDKNAAIIKSIINRKEEISDLHVLRKNLKTESKKSKKYNKVLYNKLNEQIVRKNEMEAERNEYNINTTSYENELYERKRIQEQHKKLIGMLQSEIVNLNENLKKSMATSAKKRALFNSYKQSMTDIENVCNWYKVEHKQQCKVITDIGLSEEQITKKLVHQESLLQDTIVTLNEKSNEKDNLRIKVINEKERLTNQRKLYDMLKLKHVSVGKRLVDTQLDMKECKRKINMVHVLHDQLQVNLNGRTIILKETEKATAVVENECMRLHRELDETIKNIKTTNDYLDSKQSEIQKLHSLETSLQRRRQKMKKEIEQIIFQNKTVNFKCLSRDHEILRFYNALAIQTIFNAKTDKDRSEKMIEVEELRKKITFTGHQVDQMGNKMAQLPFIQAHITQLENKLSQIQIYTSVLKEDMKHPINVHRWTILSNHYNPNWREDTFLFKNDKYHPFKFEVIRRIHRITKRLIHRSRHLQVVQSMIEEKQKICLESRKMLNRQAGPEIAEQLAVYRTALTVKQREYKMMNASLEEIRFEVSDFKDQIVHIDYSQDLLAERYINGKEGRQFTSSLTKALVDRRLSGTHSSRLFCVSMRDQTPSQFNNELRGILEEDSSETSDNNFDINSVVQESESDT